MLMKLFRNAIDAIFKKERSASLDSPEDILIALNEARYHHNFLRDEKKTIKLCDRVLRADPKNRDAMLIKAGALKYIGKRKESLNLIHAIQREWPDHWESYYLLGLHFFNEDEEKAMTHLTKSLDLDERFDNLVTTAQLAYFIGKPDYQQYLDKAKRMDPARFRNYMENCWTYEVLPI